MSAFAVSTCRSQSQSMVPGVCSWLLTFLPPVDGWREVLFLFPVWSLIQPSPPSSAKQLREGGPGGWPPTSTSSVLAPGSLQEKDPMWDNCWDCGRGQKVSQDQSAPYTSELGNLWDTETVHMSCFSSGVRQNTKNAMLFRAGIVPPPQPMALPTLKETLQIAATVTEDWSECGQTAEKQADIRHDAPSPCEHSA